MELVNDIGAYVFEPILEGVQVELKSPSEMAICEWAVLGGWEITGQLNTAFLVVV